MRVEVVLTAAVLAATACGDQGGTIEIGSEVRDSAGIRIVENERPPDGSRLGWRIDPVQTLSIGALEGEEPYLLHQVFTALRLSDGRIVVANRGSTNCGCSTGQEPIWRPGADRERDPANSTACCRSRAGREIH